MTKHPDSLVARIKGAHKLGMKTKVLSRLSGVPLQTVKYYISGKYRGDVQPDMAVEWELRAVIGSVSGSVQEG